MLVKSAAPTCDIFLVESWHSPSQKFADTFSLNISACNLKTSLKIFFHNFFLLNVFNFCLVNLLLRIIFHLYVFKYYLFVQ